MRADKIQGMIVNIQFRYVFLSRILKMLRLKCAELYVYLLFCMGVKLATLEKIT
jgi:hypothetical protein